MSAERVIANTLRLAKADLDAAKLLHVGKNRYANLRADPETQQRLDELAAKANEEHLTDDESDEYRAYVDAIDVIGILQAKARVAVRNGDHHLISTRDGGGHTVGVVCIRAGNRCEYCRVRQEDVPYARLQVEHIRPRKHGGDDTPANLALACDRCNFSKGPNLSGVESETAGIRGDVRSA